MKYAIVTGGTSGIGKQICLDLLAKDYFVITNYSNNDSNAEQSRNEFSQVSSFFQIIKCNQSKKEDISSFVNHIKNLTSQIHCIVCNAGTTLKKNFDTISNQEWEDVFMINVHSHFFIIRDLNELIQKKSKIIFIGSLLGEVPHGTSIAYGVTKAALHSLSRNLVKEFNKRETTVNVIAPGFVETEWQINKPDSIRERIYDKTAMGRFATVYEVSHVCMMLLDNSFINGATIKVDGGYSFK